MTNLVLVRHGQSLWNLENKFTGWVDIELSELGIEEAKKAGQALKEFKFDVVFTSVLKRAINTADIISDIIGYNGKFIKNEALNERHYGDLQGLNKDDIGRQYGQEQLQIWRRSYDTPPPNGESLFDTQNRVIPYYKSEIEPLLKSNKNVLIVAHGNSLRSLFMHLENISKEDIVNLNIPTAAPYLYEFDNDFKLINNKYLDIK